MSSNSQDVEQEQLEFHIMFNRNKNLYSHINQQYLPKLNTYLLVTQ